MLFRLGWRNIWRNPRRTTVILTAVIIGVWSMVFLGALMRGVADRMVRNGIAKLTGHIQIHHRGYRSDPVVDNRITNPREVDAALDQHLPVMAQRAFRVRVDAIASNARHSGGVTLVGIELAKEGKLSFIGKAVTEGRYLRAGDSHAILAGRALIEKFETRLGNKLVLMSESTKGEIASRAFRIVGVFQAEMEATEKTFLFVPICAAQEMLDLGESILEVSILLADHRDAGKIASTLEMALPASEYMVHTWQELLPLVTAMLKMYDGFILIWFVTVFVAMGFGLVNTILMAVFERIREFGLLRSLGMKPTWVVAEVLTESFFLLIIGMAAGNIVGLVSVLVLAQSGIDLSAFAEGLEFVGMSRVIVPVIHIRDIILANVTVFVLGLLVSLYPAVKAARVTPVEGMAHT